MKKKEGLNKMNKDDLKCLYCDFENDISNFPDLFYDGCEYPEQYKLLQELQDVGYNIVTCGACGYVFIQKL